MVKVFKYFFSYIVIQVICSLALTFIFSKIRGNEDITSTQIILASTISNVVAIVLFVFARWTPFSREFFQKKTAGQVMYWSVLIGLGMIIPTSWMEELIPDSWTTDILANQFKMVLADRWGYLAVGLMAPIAEELVFRGAIQRAMIAFYERKMGRTSDGAKIWNTPHWIGIGFTALLFAAIHGNPAQMPHAFIGGLLLGWLCYRSGSIVPGIIVHWVNNTAAFALYNFYPRAYDMKIIEFFGDSELRLSLAILFSLLLLIPAMLQIGRLTR